MCVCVCVDSLYSFPLLWLVRIAVYRFSFLFLDHIMFYHSTIPYFSTHSSSSQRVKVSKARLDGWMGRPTLTTLKKGGKSTTEISRLRKRGTTVADVDSRPILTFLFHPKCRNEYGTKWKSKQYLFERDSSIFFLIIGRRVYVIER